MKLFKSTTAIMMVVALAMTSGIGTTVFAASEVAPKVPTTQQTAVAMPQKEMRSTLEGLATIESINGDKQVTVKIDQQTIVLNLGDATLFVDAKTGFPSSLKDLKKGDNIYAYYSAAMTRSLPPQSSAVAIVTGVQKDQTIPKLMTVKEIMASDEKQIRFLNTDEDMIVTILKGNPISPFKTKQMVTYKDVQVGSKVFVWYDIALMSYPGQTTANKTVLINTEKTLAKTPSKITINGKNLDLGKASIVERNGQYLVPLKVVSKALGFNLTWDAKNHAASIDNGSVKTTVTVGKDAYYKASSQAIGLTNTFSYGASPEIIDGTLYVPSKMFNLLYSNEQAVSITGDTLNMSSTQN